MRCPYSSFGELLLRRPHLSLIHILGVPKAVTLYKSKVIEGYIKEWQAKLADESLTEEQQNEVIQRLAGFNKVKVTIARKLQRLIL